MCSFRLEATQGARLDDRADGRLPVSTDLGTEESAHVRSTRKTTTVLSNDGKLTGGLDNNTG